MDEKRRALLWFDFIAIIDHGHHAMTEATQDFFIEASLNVDWLAKEFTYADELQKKAKDKVRKREMIIGIISALLLAATTITGTVALFGPEIVAGFATTLAANEAFIGLAAAASRASRGMQTIAKGLRLPTEEGAHGKAFGKQLVNLNSAVGSIVGGSFNTVTGLMKSYENIKHGDDT
jgi:hypothetical protein